MAKIRKELIEYKSKSRWRIGKELQAIRELQGWEREQVACMADVTERTIEKIEHGAFNVPLDVLARVADVLGYEVGLKEKTS